MDSCLVGLFMYFYKIYADQSINLFTTRKTLQSSRKDFSCHISPTFYCRTLFKSTAHIWYFLAEYRKTVLEKRMDHLLNQPVCKWHLTYFVIRCIDSALEYKLTLCGLVLWYFKTTKFGILHIGILLPPSLPPLAHGGGSDYIITHVVDKGKKED